MELKKYIVVPSLPERIECLREMAYNVWWSWNHEVIDLFRRLDRELWETTNHNPILLLGKIKQENFIRASLDEGFLAHMDRVHERLKSYQNSQTWFSKTYPNEKNLKIVYFSAEYGLSECLPIYSGGLGILSGDHMKSSSDMGIPLVGVGLLYRDGYFRQYLNIDGWQQETFPNNDFYNLPITLETYPDGIPVTILVYIQDRPVIVQIWRMNIGRNHLYLLDTNHESNAIEDREITSQLYGGDLEMRIKQEILLGIGGIRALSALGIEPTVCHMNEGHSAFMALERIRNLIKKQQLNFYEAMEATASGNIFTTHTPVPAGNDRFPTALLEKYFAVYYKELGISWDEFLALGRENPADKNEEYCMTVLAIKMADYSNGVSKLHGKVSRNMWNRIWPMLPADEIPISSVTNGIHIRSWISRDLTFLFDRYLGPNWVLEPHDFSVWEWASSIPDEELWRTHERRRERLVAFARKRLRLQFERRGLSKKQQESANEILNPEALTIGFARRFASYKRAGLLFKNLDRLRKILSNKERPVQIIFAGKAHPKDDRGKELIKMIVHVARDPEFRRRIAFVEDYDINVARYLVQGVDVWLNTPRRPLEASGTSGMKAAANGVINLSILDGWWEEAYNNHPETGWAIGQGEEYQDLEYQDEVESNALFDLLEGEVIPTFYNRSADGLPSRWISMMKSSIRYNVPLFNTNRMIKEYFEQCYYPAALRERSLGENNFEAAKRLTKWKNKEFANWNSLKVLSIEAKTDEKLLIGSVLEVQSKVFLSQLTPEDVSVELYYGLIDYEGKIIKGYAIPMRCEGPMGNNSYLYYGALPCKTSGLHGYTVRILPKNTNLSHPYEMSLIHWA